MITSNGGIEEWLGPFDAPILAGSALDRQANASYWIVIDGESYRQRLAPHRALLERKEVVDPPNPTPPSNHLQAAHLAKHLWV